MNSLSGAVDRGEHTGTRSSGTSFVRQTGRERLDPIATMSSLQRHFLYAGLVHSSRWTVTQSENCLKTQMICTMDYVYSKTHGPVSMRLDGAQRHTMRDRPGRPLSV